MEYKSNGNVACSCRHHVVFCLKYRRQVLVDGVDGRLKEIVQDVADETSFEIIEIEVMPDHVRLLLEAGPQLGVCKAVNASKAGRATNCAAGARGF